MSNRYVPESFPATAPSNPIDGAEPNLSAEDFLVFGEAASIENHFKHLLNANVSRRSVNIFGALVLGSGLLQRVEQPIMDHHYGDTDTTIMIARPSKLSFPLSSAGLVSPGWGGTHGNSIVDNLRRQQVYKPDFPLGYYHFSNSNVTLTDIRLRGREFGEKLNPQKIDVHGVSEGGIIALTGALAAGKQVRLINTLDSPFDIDDARHAWLARGVVALNKLGIYGGELIGKYATCLLEDIDKKGIHELFTGWFEAARDTWNGADPRMMDSQLSLLQDADLHGQRRAFGKIINKDTQVVISKTQLADTDPVTKDSQSTEKWIEFYHANGATVMIVEVPTPGHAPTAAGIAAAAPHMRRLLHDLGD